MAKHRAPKDRHSQGSRHLSDEPWEDKIMNARDTKSIMGSPVPSESWDSPCSIQETPDHFNSPDIESQKKTVKENFKFLHEKLYEKEESIMNSLENRMNSHKHYEASHLDKLHETKENLTESMKDPQLASTLAEAYANIQAQITRIEKQVMGKKHLKWKINECEIAIENACSVCEGKDILNSHKSKKELLWENVRHGSERTQVNRPVGLAIESKTDRIYVADAGNKRIQIFNSDGNHLSQISLNQFGQICMISFIGDHLFLIDMRGADQLCISKMNPTGSKTICKVLTNLDMSYSEFYTRQDLSSVLLFDLKKIDTFLTICVYKNNHKLWNKCYTPDTLTKMQGDRDGEIELHSPYIKDFTSALDVKIVGTSYELTDFYVLYKNSPYAVQIFNWRGEVVRAMVSLSLDTGLSLLLVDEEHNLIICNVKRINEDSIASDEEVQNLYTNYVFSDDGKMQHKWNYKSANRGWITQLLLKPWMRKQPAITTRLIDGLPYFAACLNSKQVLVVLHNLESSFLLRAF